MNARFIKLMLWAGIAIVVGLLGLNAYIAFKPAAKARITAPLASLLPPAPAGWTAEDTPIADTPEMLENVEKVLHYDDAAYRIYNNGYVSLGVYVAHWLPGGYSPAKVGSHSPDTCWVRNGWDRIESEKNVSKEVGGGELKPMTIGEFSKDRGHLYVIFWHLVGGQPVNYDLVDWRNGIEGRIQRLPAMLSDFSKFGLDQRQEQIVVRISSTVPFEKLWNDPSFNVLMEELGRSFDLYAKPPPDTNSAPVAQRASVPVHADEVRAH